MKVLGQAEGMQFENLDDFPEVPSPGLVYFHTEEKRSYQYVGDAWLPFVMDQANAATPIIGSSKEVTVDWSTGLRQSLALFAYDVRVKFTNWVSGQEHSLFVYQGPVNVFSTPQAKICRFIFDLPGQYNSRKNLQPSSLPPESVKCFRWFAGFGPAGNVVVPVTNPRVLPTTALLSIDVNRDGSYLIGVEPGTSPYNANYPFIDQPAVGAQTANSKASASYGPKNFQAPDTFSAAGIIARYHPNGAGLYYAYSGGSIYAEYLYLNTPIAGGSQQFVAAGSTTALANLDVHPKGSFLAIVGNGTQKLYIYSLNGMEVNTGGTVSPVVAPSSSEVATVAWSPYGDYIAIMGPTTPYINVYPFDDSSGTISAAAANPGTLPVSGTSIRGARGIAWRPQGDWIVAVMAGSPYIYVVPFNRTTGAFGTPQTLTAGQIPPGAVITVCFSPCGSFLFCGTSSAGNYGIYYSFGSGGITSAYASVNATAQVNDAVFSPNGEFIHMALNATPFIQTVTAPTITRTYLRMDP